MKSTPIIVGTVSSVLLIGAAIALHFLTPPGFDARFRTAIGSIQAMQQLGAEWSVETARVRADPTSNFDGLAAFVPRMKQLKANLSESLAHIPDLPERLTADSRAYLAAMDSLRERVERFKTAYAVIRNSERYFPLASADLILRAEQAGNKPLARGIADVSVEMDAYLSSPSDSARESLSARLLELTEGRTRETDQVASSIANFAAHANVLLDRRARSQELFKGITSSTLSERTRPLTAILEAELEERRRATTLHRQALVGLGAGVLLVWIAVGFARRSATTRRPAPERSAPSQRGAAEREVVSGPEPVRVAARPRAGGAAQRDEEGTDVMEALLTTGAFAGLMGQSMGAYARRVGEDLKVLDRDAEGAQTEREAEAAQRWRRLHADARRLGFFAPSPGRSRPPPRAEGSGERRREPVSRRGPERGRSRDDLRRRAILQGGSGRGGVESGGPSHPRHVHRPRAAVVSGHDQLRGRARGLDRGRHGERHDLLHPQRRVAPAGSAREPVHPVLWLAGSGGRARAPRRPAPRTQVRGHGEPRFPTR